MPTRLSPLSDSRQRQAFARQGPLHRRARGTTPCVGRPLRKIVCHVERQRRPQSPHPVHQQIGIGDAVALADRPRPVADLRVYRLPQLPTGLLGGGGDVLGRARVGCIAGRAPDVGEGNVNGRRQPAEPFGAARLLPRVPRPKPGGRMARRNVAKDCWTSVKVQPPSLSAGTRALGLTRRYSALFCWFVESSTRESSNRAPISSSAMWGAREHAPGA